MNETPWPEFLVGECFNLSYKTITPSLWPNTVFAYYSIPALDDANGPTMENGKDIGSNKTVIEEPTILVSKLNPRIPRVALVNPTEGTTCCASTEFIPYTKKTDQVDLRFFTWYFGSQSFQRHLERVATGSTNSHTRARPSETLLWKIRCPPSDEQTRIAYVLDTINEAIAKTEAVIWKLKQIRAGMIHDLLSYGLDEHDQLRDPIAHPEQFKDSPLGRIPKEWEVEALGSRLQANNGVIQTGPFGSQLHAHQYTPEGIPVVMPQDIRDGWVNDVNISRIPVRRAEDMRRHRVEVGDLLFARRGDLSRCCAIAKREAGWLCGTGCLLMRFDQYTLTPAWLSIVYAHDTGQRQIAARAVGSAMVNLNTTLLSHLLFAFPSRAEQLMVVDKIKDFDIMISKEIQISEKLGLLKSGLQNDLLTGRVRVPETIMEGVEKA